jgi:hypothetical protein
MSKPQAVAEKERTELAPTRQSSVPDYLKEAVSRDAGQGISTDAADNIVPLIYCLDAKSQQCDHDSGAYIPGAKAGSIWLRNYHKPLVDGAEGILFQPCHFSKDWVEWRPREIGGGFIGRYDWNDKTEFGQPPDAVERPHPENPKKMRWMLPNGNEVKETRHHAGYVYIDGGAFPFVIPMSSTGHTVSKNWMFTMMSKRTPDDKIVPSYSSLYRLRTRQRSNAQGKWYVFDVTDEGYVPTAGDYDRGKMLHDAFEAGDKVAAAEESGVEEAPAGPSDKM